MPLDATLAASVESCWPPRESNKISSPFILGRLECLVWNRFVSFRFVVLCSLQLFEFTWSIWSSPFGGGSCERRRIVRSAPLVGSGPQRARLCVWPTIRGFNPVQLAARSRRDATRRDETKPNEMTQFRSQHSPAPATVGMHTNSESAKIAILMRAPMAIERNFGGPT